MSIHKANIFYSYSHKDEHLRESLETHLAILKRQGLIEDWNDRKILPGFEWEQIIDSKLEEADIILLLVSPDFIASDYCYGKELSRALDKHEQMQAIVVPVIIRPVDWQAAPFAKFQALPKDGKPVTSWSNNDEAWLSVTKGLRKIIEEIPIEKSSIVSDEGLIKLSGPLKSELNRLGSLHSKKMDEISGRSTGFINLDRWTDGLHRKDVVLIGGRPRMGKTDFVLNIALNFALAEALTVAFFSFRLPPDQIIRRLLASKSMLTADRLEAGFISNEDWIRLKEATGIFSKLPIFVDGSSCLSVKDITVRLNKIKQSNEIDLIVIDGLEYIVSEAKDRNREAEVFSIIKDLKNLVRQYDSPLILTVHVSQQVDQRADRRPRLADLKDWELFVSDVANVVLFLYRDELYDPDSPNRGIAELIVGKNVHRQTGVLNLSYIRHLSTFSNIAASLNPENFE
jgi:replicative DNA helicase